MPLTFAHPAIILPLNYLPKRWFSLTGLIVGSVVPDFEYFIRMKVYSIYSHTWFGLIWFDLPLAFVLTFVYHNIVRDMLISNLPRLLYRRLSIYKGFNWNNYAKKNLLVVVISILIGAASHLFWDSFTHENGYFVIVFNMINPVNVLGVYLPLYKVIQHLSTLAGGIVILIAISKLKKMSDQTQNNTLRYWVMVVAVVIAVLALRIALGLSILQYPNLIVTALSGFIAGVILVPVIVKSDKQILN